MSRICSSSATTDASACLSRHRVVLVGLDPSPRRRADRPCWRLACSRACAAWYAIDCRKRPACSRAQRPSSDAPSRTTGDALTPSRSRESCHSSSTAGGGSRETSCSAASASRPAAAMDCRGADARGGHGLPRRRRMHRTLWRYRSRSLVTLVGRADADSGRRTAAAAIWWNTNAALAVLGAVSCAARRSAASAARRSPPTSSTAALCAASAPSEPGPATLRTHPAYGWRNEGWRALVDKTGACRRVATTTVRAGPPRHGCSSRVGFESRNRRCRRLAPCEASALLAVSDSR